MNKNGLLVNGVANVELTKSSCMQIPHIGHAEIVPTSLYLVLFLPLKEDLNFKVHTTCNKASVIGNVSVTYCTSDKHTTSQQFHGQPNVSPVCGLQYTTCIQLSGPPRHIVEDL